jgi:hypothetical protein
METEMSMHEGLPVAGYRPQTTIAVDAVNVSKQMEERVLRMLDDMAKSGICDPRWFAIGRTAIEQGFMAINRSVFQPSRVALPSDAMDNAT